MDKTQGRIHPQANYPPAVNAEGKQAISLSKYSDGTGGG